MNFKKKLFIYCFIILTFVINSLNLGNLTFHSVMTVSTYWLVPFVWWVFADWYIEKKRETSLRRLSFLMNDFTFKK